MTFLKAAYHRDYAGMEAALNSGDATTLYSEDLCGNTAMHYAVYCSDDPGTSSEWWCHLQPVKKDPKADQDAQDQDAQKMVQFLLKEEQQIQDKNGVMLVNKVNKDGWAPLNYATEGNLLNTVKELLKAGADMNTTPPNGLRGAGDTPLINSAWHSNYEITKLLLSKGAMVNIMQRTSNHNHWNVLTIACSRNLPEIAKTVLKSEQKEITPEFLSLTTEDGDSALSFALAYGLSEVVQLLISLGASLYTPRKSMSQRSQNNEALSTEEMKLLNIDPITLTKFFDNHITVDYCSESAVNSSSGCNFNEKEKIRSELYKVENTVMKFDYKCMKPVYKTVRRDSVEYKQYEAGQKEGKDYKYMRNPLILHDYNIRTDTKVLEDIVSLSQNHKTILKHPLSRALLMKKWNKIKNYYLGWIIFNTFFLICLVALAVAYGPSLKNGMKQLKTNASTILKNSTVPNTASYQEHTIYQAHTRQCALVVFTTLLGFMVLVELLQIGVSLKKWMKEAKNYGQLVIIVLSLFLVYDLFQVDQKYELDLHLLGFLIPMVFYGLLHEYGYHPALAKYILLLDKVCRTFFFHGAVYIGLVIMPAISFYLIIGEKDDSFSDDFSKLFAKTVVMFVGEVELFPVSSNTTFKWFEIGFFFFFIFFLVVVLMNLLNALAILDTEALLEDVEMEMLYSLLETVAFWENLRENDTHNKFTWSLLKKINNLITPSIFKCVPNSSVLDEDRCMDFRPYKSTGKEQQHLEFGKGRFQTFLNCMGNSIHSKADLTIESIETSAFAIVHRKKEEERCKKKEQAREEKEEKLEKMVIEIHKHFTSHSGHTPGQVFN